MKIRDKGEGLNLYKTQPTGRIQLKMRLVQLGTTEAQLTMPLPQQNIRVEGVQLRISEVQLSTIETRLIEPNFDLKFTLPPPPAVPQNVRGHN